MQKWSIIMVVRMVLFFHLPTPGSPQCRAGTAQECQMSIPDVPGLHYALSGIDITTFHRSDNSIMDLSKTPVGTCTVCDNPLQNKRQNLPWAIANWTANILCQQKVQHMEIHSVVSVAKAMTELLVKNDWKTGLDVEVNSSAKFERVLAGSQADFISFTAQRLSSDNYIFLLHHVSCSYYKFSIDKDKAVGDYFKGEVMRLPERYDLSSKRKYRELISFFGTHFITEVDLGAAFRFLTAIPLCRIQLENINASQINKCQEIQLGNIIGLDAVTKEPDFPKCRETLKKLTDLWLHKEQAIYFVGGSVTSRFDLVNTGFWNKSREWLESVKSEPGLFSYSVEPIHILVDHNNPRRDSLRKAVSEYVSERTLWWNCTPSCPEGVQQNSSDSCYCECPNDNFTNSMCCPQKLGLARLRVTIESATHLWGDYFTGTDAYVKVAFKDKIMCTPTIWNNNNPVWNAKLDFGIIQLTEDFSHIHIEVWDEDVVQRWNDLLGKCVVLLESWNSNSHNCHIRKEGTLNYRYFLGCGPRLGGPTCRDYF